MKRKLLAAACATVIAGTIAWASNPVYSVNAVGYVKLDLRQGYTLCSFPWTQVGGATPTIDFAFGANCPDGTLLMFYDAELQHYEAQSYNYSVDDGAWLKAGNNAGGDPILRGEGFWVYSPQAVTITIQGEVPSQSTASETPIPLVVGYNFVGSGYPAPLPVTNSLVANDGDLLMRYVGPGPEPYTQWNYSPDDGGWLRAGNLEYPVLQPGEGMIYKVFSVSNTWTQIKPYTWP